LALSASLVAPLPQQPGTGPLVAAHNPYRQVQSAASYLCGGRPAFDAMPLDTTAAITIFERASAGIFVGPSDMEGSRAGALRSVDRLIPPQKGGKQLRHWATT